MKLPTYGQMKSTARKKQSQEETRTCRKEGRRQEMEKVIRKKHIWEPKLAKHVGLGAVLEVAMSEKCTPLWREAHFQ